MWPLNLIRDFPARSGRLGRTIWSGLKGVLFLVPAFIGALRWRRLGNWRRQMPGRLANWVHLFVTQIFDLLGGPEIAQFFMHLITNTTPLTTTEMEIMVSILGPNAMRYGDVRVAEGGLFDLVFKLNGNLAFSTWHTINFPRNGRFTRKNLPVVVHELTHAYQYEQVGSRYLGEAIYVLVKTKRDCYRYGGGDGLRIACANGKRYCDYNREQQAQIVQDYYILRGAKADVTAYEPFIDQLCSRRL
jgi:hypothetical protein